VVPGGGALSAARRVDRGLAACSRTRVVVLPRSWRTAVTGGTCVPSPS